MKIYENPWTSMKMYRNLWKSMKIYDNLRKSMKSMNMYGIYLFWKRNIDYISYFKNVNASHICPPKRNKLFKQRTWKSRFSGKPGLWPAEHETKSQAVSSEPIMKVHLLAKVLKSTCCTKNMNLQKKRKEFG